MSDTIVRELTKRPVVNRVHSSLKNASPVVTAEADVIKPKPPA